MSEGKAGIGRAAFGVALIVALIIGAAGGYYGGISTVAPGVTTVTVTAPSKIVIGVTDKVSDLDPSNAYDFYTWEVLTNVMEGLMKYVPGTTTLELGIAQSYSVSEDGTVYTFKLKPGLRFADGKPADANNVAWSVNRAMTINGDPGWLVVDFLQSVEAVDAETVKFTLSKPVAYFLSLVATPPYFTVHPSYNPEAYESDQTAGGLGPYRIARWERDVQLVLEANPYYYGGAPKTNTLIIRFFATASAMRLALEAGEIDIAWRTLTPTDVRDLKAKADLQVQEVPGAYIRYIVINENIPPFDNILVRQALAAAVDRGTIAEKVFLGTVQPLYSMVPIGMWSHTDAFKDKFGERDLELAKNLLKQAGYSETKKLTFDLWYTPTHYGDTEADVALILKEDWEETGMIAVELKTAEWATYLDQTRAVTYPVCLYGWYPDYIDPDDYTTPWVDQAWTGRAYKNPTLSEILDAASVAQTVEERTQLYEQAQDIWADDAAVIPLFQGSLTVVSKGNVRGIYLDPVMLFRYWLVYFAPA